MPMRLPIVCLLLAAAAVLPGCKGKQQPAAEVTVSAVWARATPPGSAVGAVYLQLDNKSARPDALLTVEAAVAERVEIHSMEMQDGTMMMRAVEKVALPAHEQVRLEPGGLHIMLMNLKAPLVQGEQFPLTLRFEHTPAQTVTAQIMPLGAEAPAGAAEGEHSHSH